MNSKREQAELDAKQLKRLKEVGLKRNTIEFRLLCAFNGIEPHQAPEHFWWFHNPYMRDAWKRVAAKAEEIFKNEQ